MKQIVEEIPFGADELVQALLGLPASRRVCILDSCGARPPDARFLIAGFDAFEVIEERQGAISVSRLGNSAPQPDIQTVLHALDERIESYSSHFGARPNELPAYGACIATFSYELGRKLERFHRAKWVKVNESEPLATLSFFEALIIHDYQSGRSFVTSSGGPKPLEACKISLKDAVSRRFNPRYKTSAPAESRSPAEVSSNFTKEDYIRAVMQIEGHIAAGDIYQANLTQQFTATLPPELTAEKIFWRLRRDHPASFAAFIRRSDDVIVSASPERFLHVEVDGDERRVEAWPIKGTRARGTNAAEDRYLRDELYRSTKDRAENVMIVDLVRNDLGRVCRYGSISVPELFTVQEHPTLFHLVSKVRGVLREGISTADLIRAAFPCGSITGAPKIRAMEIIDEIERTPRGASMGAIGYFSFDGCLDLNVAIRTLTINGRIARFNTGGGIVADSDPEAEYDESLAKAKALLKALSPSNLPGDYDRDPQTRVATRGT